jgi:hypothetical protein
MENRHNHERSHDASSVAIWIERRVWSLDSSRDIGLTDNETGDSALCLKLSEDGRQSDKRLTMKTYEVLLECCHLPS